MKAVSCFNQLYDEGLIYRGKRLVNWDPNYKQQSLTLKSSIPMHKAHCGIKYPLSDGTGHIVIATTRLKQCWVTPQWPCI